MKSKHKQAERLEWQRDYGDHIVVTQTVNANIESRKLQIERTIELNDRVEFVGEVWASHAEISKMFGRYKQPNGKYVIPLGGKKMTTAGVKYNNFTRKYKPDVIELSYEIELVPSLHLGKCKYNEVIIWNTVSQSETAAEEISKRVRQSRYKTKFQTSWR